MEGHVLIALFEEERKQLVSSVECAFRGECTCNGTADDAAYGEQ